MGDSINVDWSQLAPPQDFVGDYTNAFKVGQDMAGQASQRNALAQYATDPVGAANALMPVNPALSMQLQDRTQQQGDRAANVRATTAFAGGDYAGAEQALAPTGDLAGIEKLDTAHKAALSQSVEQTGAMLHSLAAEPDPAVRLAKAQHLAAQSPEAAKLFGLDPNSMTADDVSPQAFARYQGTLAAIDRAAMTPAERATADRPQIVGKDSSLLFPPSSSGGMAPDAPAAGAAATPSASATPPSAGGLTAPAGVDATQGVAAQVVAEATKQGVDPNLALRIAKAESNFNPAARSPKGAFGTMQLMAATAQGLGVDPTDPADNIKGGVAYLKQLSDQFHGDPQLIAAAYNAGPSAVRTYGGVPPYAETQAYVNKVAPPGSYQVASNGPTPGPPTASPAPAAAPNLPPGYRLVSLGGGGAAAAPHGHLATGPELSAAGLPAGTQAWTNAKGEVGDVPAALATQITPATPGDLTKTGEDYLATIPHSDAVQIRAMMAGRSAIPPASSRSKTAPIIRAELAQTDPNFDEAQYKARSGVESDFTSAKNGSTGGALVSASKAINHLTNLDGNVALLENNGWKGGNTVGNWLKTQTGNPAVEPFRADRNALALELTKFFAGARGGSEGEVNHWLGILDDSKSPQALHAAVKEVVGLMGGQVGPIASQYNQAMGTNRPDEDFLDPQAAAKFQGFRGDTTEQIQHQAFVHQYQHNLPNAPASAAETAYQKFAATRQAHQAHAAATAPPGARQGAPDRHGNVVLGAE